MSQLSPRGVETLRRALVTRAAWLYPLIVFAAGYQPLIARGRLGVGTVAVEPTDIGIAIALCAAAVLWFRRGHPLSLRPEFLLVAGLVAVLFAPVFIGLADGHSWQSSLYPARAAAALLVFFATWELVRDGAAAARVLTCVLVVALVGAAAGALAHVMGWQWSNAMSTVVTTAEGTISRGYGWWSAMPWYVYGSIVAVGIALLARTTPWRRRAAWVAAALLALSTVSTLIRGDFLGLVAGILALIVIVFLASTKGSPLRRRLVLAVATTACLLVVAVGAAAVVRPSAVRALGERTISIFVPSATSAYAQATRSDRVEAATYGVKASLEYPLGIGYGYPTPVLTLTEARGRYFATHSGIAWVGTYLGIVGGVLFALAAAALAVIAVRHTLRSSRATWAAAAALGILVAMVMQSAAASVLFSDHYTYPLAPIVLAIALKPFFAPGREEVPADA